VLSFPHVSPTKPVRTYSISIRAARRRHLVFLHFINLLKVSYQQILEVPGYVVFHPLLPRPIYARMSSSALFSRTNLAYNNIFIKQILCTAQCVTNHTLISAQMRLGI
jgi:hypothetical protein